MSILGNIYPNIIMPRKKQVRKRSQKSRRGKRSYRSHYRRRGGTARKSLRGSPWTTGSRKALTGPAWTSSNVGSNHFSRSPHDTFLSPNLSCSGSIRSYSGGRTRRRRTHSGGRWAVPLVQPIFNGFHEYSGKTVAAFQGKPAWSGQASTSPDGQPPGYTYSLV